MDYFLFFISVLVVAFFIDFFSIPFRLGLKGTIKGYKLLVWGVGYRKKAYSIERASRPRVLILGDSTGFDPGAHLKETLPGRLASKYDVSIVDVATDGWKTRKITSQLDEVGNQRFSLAIVFAGNNDIWRFTSFKALEEDISKLLDMTKRRSDTVVLFRGGNIGNCPFFPVFFSRIYTYRSRRVRKIFMRVAKKKGVIYVEKWMERRDDVFLKEPRKFYSWDLLHLNGRGLEIWFDFLDERMKEEGVRLPELPRK